MSYKLSYKQKGIAVALATAGLAGVAQAAGDVYELEEIVVTASRTAQTVDQALAPVTVITRDDIERSQATSVTELLAKTPGMQMSSYGGAGSLSNVYLRGTSTAQTLVLLDGQKINTVQGNAAPLQYIDPAMIERIEIVRGPRSSLYGADALGGVIQIFTRKGSGEPHLSLKVGGGSHNTGEYGISLSGEKDGTRYNLGASLYETSGYDHTFSTEGGNDDDDGYRNKSVFGNVSKQLTDDLEAGFTFSHAEGKSEYDNDPSFAAMMTTQPYYLFRLTNVGAFAEYTVTESWNTRLEAGYAEEFRRGKTEDNQTGEHSDSFFSDSRRYSASWKNDISWLDSQLLTAGVDHSNETYEGSTDYEEDSRSNTGVFIQNHSAFERSTLEVSLRNDENEAYGNHTTGGISYGYDLTRGLRFIASYGTAFRAPTMADLYFPDYDNPDLKPEKSENIEFGLKGRINNSTWSATFFQNDMEDMIATDETYTPINIDDARIRGAEFVVRTDIAGWAVNANLTILDPENRSGVNKGKVLRYRAQELFTLDLDRQFQKVGLGATFRAQGKSYKDAANEVEVAGFGTVDLRASMDLTKELKAGLKVVNLLDKEYQAVDGYRAEPLGAYVTFTWTPVL